MNMCKNENDDIIANHIVSNDNFITHTFNTEFPTKTWETNTIFSDVITTDDNTNVQIFINEQCLKSLFINSTYCPKIKKIIFNNPTTIVFFEDESKSIVKASNEDSFNKTTGVIYAIIKRIYGSIDLYDNEVKGNGYMNHLEKIIETLSFDQQTKK